MPRRPSLSIVATIVEVVDTILPGYQARSKASDDLVRDLQIDSDDLSFYVIPEIERRLGIHPPAAAWSRVSRIDEIAEMLVDYSN
jgi:hypothetical protein